MYRRGNQHHKWVTEGSKVITKSGYVKLKSKSYENSINGWIYEHVAVMSDFLKRPLRRNESVHHRNGVKDDNRIENLELWDRGQPAGQKTEDKIKWAKEFLEEHGYSIIRKEATTQHFPESFRSDV